jgi:riboflavin biosynthesis pyrimidine reductase
MAPMLLGGNNSAIGDIGITNMDQALELEVLETTRIGKDIFIRARSA